MEFMVELMCFGFGYLFDVFDVGCSMLDFVNYFWFDVIKYVC